MCLNFRHVSASYSNGICHIPFSFVCSFTYIPALALSLRKSDNTLFTCFGLFFVYLYILFLQGKEDAKAGIYVKEHTKENGI